MALENGYQVVAHALPTPTDTPYQTPTRDASQLSSRRASSSLFSNSPPLPLPPDVDTLFPRPQRHDDDLQKRSSIDPRDFPSEEIDRELIGRIHTLNAELETKITAMKDLEAAMESLEESLHQTKDENIRLQRELDKAKSLPKEMRLLEKETIAAVEGMAKERDSAAKNTADRRERLEVSKKKVRSLEEDAEKTHEIWEKERSGWRSERSKLQLKVQVVENQLKTMVDEMTKLELAAQDRLGRESELDESTKENTAYRGNDSFSFRSNSRADSRLSIRSNDEHEVSKGRVSRLSALREVGGSRNGGLSLADELGGEEDEDEGDDLGQDPGPRSPDELPEENQFRSQRYSEDQKARKMMGLPSEYEPSDGDVSDRARHSMGIIMHYANLPGRETPSQYTDASTQFFRPSSAQLPVHPDDGMVEKLFEQTEIAANQRRKRVSIPLIPVEQTSTAKPDTSKTTPMVSTGSQTDEIPSTVVVALQDASATSDSAALPVNETRDASTQASEVMPVAKSASNRLAPTSLDVPVIAIHPPASRPPSSHNSVVLPPRTKNAGSQVSIEIPKSLRSISIQTDDIRVDKRPVRVWPRLQPSKASSQSRSRSSGEKRTQASQALPPRIPRRNLRSPPPVLPDEPPPASPPIPSSYAGKDDKWASNDKVSIGPSYHPGKNDDGPLNGKKPWGPRRPIRSESILAGFDDTNDEDIYRSGNDLSDDDFQNVKPIKKTVSKVKDSWKLVPHSKDSVLDRLESASEDTEAQDVVDVPEKNAQGSTTVPRTISKTFNPKGGIPAHLRTGDTKDKDIRRTALVSSGATAHTQRARSPSAPSAPASSVVAPPFPVPTRSSSRKIPVSASDGAASPTPNSTSFFTARRNQGQGRPPVKRKILRKVQSAAAVTKPPGPVRPHPMPSASTSSIRPDTPKSPLPQPSRHQFILPDILPDSSNVEQRSRPAAPSGPLSHTGEASIESPDQQIGVSHALAQTMVGEWMWKYVRKRSSFGITETPQAEFAMGKIGENGSSGGVRHKRWVWLVPMERMVLWSSKEPKSGPAMLGKGGRKLSIQSVVDVKDDTPVPKGSGSQLTCDRSILILTPERALKFTAVSIERHYVWLTALSYLTSSQGVSDLGPLSSLHPHQEFHRPPSREPVVNFRPTPIRDSIRVAKGRSRPSIGPQSFSFPSPEMENAKVPVAWEGLERPSEEAAEPPHIPRSAAHARKRSSTGPLPIPLSNFHSYPSGNVIGVASSFDLHAPTARDKYDKYQPRLRRGSGPSTTQSTMTHRTNESTAVIPNDFFDAISTVRMEAFVDKQEPQLVEPSKPKKENRSYRTRQGRKKDMKSYWGIAESVSSEPRWKGEDPFRGF